MNAEPSLRKVLMTADTVGGVWTFVLGLAASLSARGIRVTIATMGEPLRAAQRTEASRLAGIDVRESTYRLEWMDDPWDDVARAGQWLLDLERAIAPDVVHLNGYAHAALPWRAPVLVTAHSCVLSWWRAVHGEEAPPKYARYRREVARGLGAADGIVAPTKAMMTSIQETYAPSCRAVVIANAADPARFTEGRKDDLIFAAGRFWDPAKNLGVLDEAARRVRFPIVIAGSTSAPSGTSHRPVAMRSLGWLDARGMAEWMSRASIYVHPARYEPFGLSVLEAALARCALVLGDIPSLREVWGDAALYASPTDPEALAEALERVTRDPALRRDLAAAAHSRALTYAPERMAAAYLAQYRQICGARTTKREARSCA